MSTISKMNREKLKAHLSKGREPVQAAGFVACCGPMEFALKHAIIRQNLLLHFGTDVMPPPLTNDIVACPWCGKPTLNNQASPQQSAQATGYDL